jgi:hypothetical protein
MQKSEVYACVVFLVRVQKKLTKQKRSSNAGTEQRHFLFAMETAAAHTRRVGIDQSVSQSSPVVQLPANHNQLTPVKEEVLCEC